MEALILDKNYETLSVLDTFSSFIWTDRFQGYGDFQIVTNVDPNILQYIIDENYLCVPNSNRYMIIETFQIEDEPGKKSKLTITGRSLESILERRVISHFTSITGNLQNGIARLLNENAITPSNTNRKIPGLRMELSTDPLITGLEVDVQYLGKNLYDAILELCKESDIGFSILPEDSGGFVFKLYAGVDRTYYQDEVPPVVFSPDFENLLSSNYISSKKVLKTAAFVGGEGEGQDRKIVEALDKNSGGEGLDRREIFVDAYGTSSSDGSNDGMSQAQYENQLKTKGTEELANTNITQAFEGCAEVTKQFVYGSDFFLGDIVQIRNNYGLEARSRIDEMVMSHEASGEKFYPTFVSIE